MQIEKPESTLSLVSEVGVGTIAAGVAKAKADVVLVSGYRWWNWCFSLNVIKTCGSPLGVRNC